MRLCVGNSIVIIVGTTQGNDVLQVDSRPEYLPSLFALPILRAAPVTADYASLIRPTRIEITLMGCVCEYRVPDAGAFPG
jgi:hypothetical protein